MQEIIDNNDRLYTEDLQNLNDRYSKGKTTTDEYNKELERLQKEHAKTEISNAISLTESLIANLKARGYDVIEYERQLNEQKQQFHLLYGASVKSTNKEIAKSEHELQEEREQIAEKQKEIVYALYELGQTLVLAGIEREKNALRELQDQRNENYEREIENIRNSTLSEEQKAARITVLEAKQRAERLKYEKEQRDLDYKKAKFERDTQVLKIFGETLVQAAKAGFITPLGLLISALGAIQITTLLARPIPRYKLGTPPEGHPGGTATYGEVPEEVTEPGKKPYRVDREVTGYLPKGTKVRPLTSNELNKMMHSAMIIQTAEMLSAGSNINKANDEQVGYLKEIVYELKSNRKQQPQKSTLRVISNKKWERWNASIDKDVRGIT